MEKKIRRLIEIKELELYKLKEILTSDISAMKRQEIELKIALKTEIIEELKDILPRL